MHWSIGQTNTGRQAGQIITVNCTRTQREAHQQQHRMEAQAFLVSGAMHLLLLLVHMNAISGPANDCSSSNSKTKLLASEQVWWMIAFCKCVDEKLLAPMMRRKKRRKRRINIFCIFASSSVDASAAPTRAVILSEGYPKRKREKEREKGSGAHH